MKTKKIKLTNWEYGNLTKEQKKCSHKKLSKDRVCVSGDSEGYQITCKLCGLFVFEWFAKECEEKWNELIKNNKK